MRGTKKLFITILLISISKLIFAQGGLFPYYKVGIQKGTIDAVAAKVITCLKTDSFEILGEYNPGKRPDLYVIAFTRKDLKDITFQNKNRDALASIMKVGLIAKGKEEIEITLLNPEFVFYAFMRDEISNYESELLDISMEIKITLRKVGTEFLPLESRSLSEDELKSFKFMSKDPGFDQPFVINTFSSFKKGIRTIDNNLKSRREETVKVFEMIDEEKKIAIFGVGMLHDKIGEGLFLNELGSDHLSCLPYLIILEDKTASILDGQYFFPLFWTNLTMREFLKIYRTHRDIQETMIKLTQ